MHTISPWVCFLCLPGSRHGLLQRRRRWRTQLKVFHEQEAVRLQSIPCPRVGCSRPQVELRGRGGGAEEGVREESVPDVSRAAGPHEGPLAVLGRSAELARAEMKCVGLGPMVTRAESQQLGQVAGPGVQVRVWPTVWAGALSLPREEARLVGGGQHPLLPPSPSLPSRPGPLGYTRLYRHAGGSH